MRVMYDTIAGNAGKLPLNANFYAGYIDGLYRWTAAEWDRFPAQSRVTITVLASPQAMVYDCEPGNGTPADAVSYARGRVAQGKVPTVYCGEGTWWPEIRSLMSQAGLTGKVNYWVANYTYNPSVAVPAGAIGIQWSDKGGGGAWDISNIADHWPGVDSGSAPAPAPAAPAKVETVENVKVTGTVWQAAAWLNWTDLAPVGQTAAKGTRVTYTEAKLVGGKWYDRIAQASGQPGAWCLPDEWVDTGGTNPAHYGAPKLV